MSYADRIEIIDDTGTPHWLSGLYVLKNLSTGDDYKFSYGDNLAPDFSVFVDGTNEYYLIGCNGSQLKLLKLSDTKIEDFEINSPIDLTNITALYISRNSNTDEIPIYIAITSSDNNGTTANIYTGTISTGDTLTLDININQPLLSLDINSFINNDGNFSFYNSAFMISDMYINEDKSKLYVTAGCVNYNTKSWYYNDYSDGGIYHSFGGLFEYTFGDDGELKTNEITKKPEVIRYGINNNYDVNNPNTPVDPENENEADPNPFLTNTINPDTTNPDGGSQAISLETHIIQATSADSEYFAGPRYIIPSGNDLLIIDSGFYGLVDKTLGTNNPFSLYGKQNRIFTFNTETKGLSLTKVDDSISFDYDYLTSSSQY